MHRKTWPLAPVAALVLAFGMIGGARAATELFTISIEFGPPTVETLHSDGSILCEVGTAESGDFHFAGNGSTAATFHLTKLLDCGSGNTLLIRVNAGSNLLRGTGTTGGWSVVPGSGTGDFAGLVGGGNIVGIPDGPNLTDHYFGSLHH